MGTMPRIGARGGPAVGGEARGQTAAVRGGDQGQRQVSPQISPPSPPSLPSLPAPPERPVGEPEGAHDEEADYPPPLATQGWGVPPQQLVPFLPPPAVRLVTVAPGQKGGKGAAGADPALLAAEAGRPDQLRPFARGSPLAPGRHQSPMGLATQQQESTGGAEQWEEELIARERREMAEPARTAGAHFRGMQRDYLEQVYKHQGGCPEVMLPDSAPVPNFPHLWASLRDVVRRGLPLWMPGRYEGKTPILVGTGGKRRTMAMDARTSPEYATWQTQYGEVQAVKVPQTVYEATVQCGYHHVGTMWTREGKFA